MNIVLFEGIAGSGKTTIEQRLSERLPDVEMLSEDKTLMPLIENKNVGVALAYLSNQLNIIRRHGTRHVIIDRFHFTHAFRTHADLSVFSSIEQGLLDAGNVLAVLLTIDPGCIQERLEETIGQRKDNWKKGAQGSLEDKVAYYKRQQEILTAFLPKSRLRTLRIDTTEKQWDTYVDQIVNELRKATSDLKQEPPS